MTKKKKEEDLQKRGRKTVMTAEIIAKLEQAFKLGESDEDACDYAGISMTSLYEYQRKNPEFAHKKQAWKKNPTHKARFTMYKNLDDPRWAAWWLERKEKEEFSTMQKVDNSVSFTEGVPIVSNADLLEIMKRRQHDRERATKSAD